MNYFKTTLLLGLLTAILVIFGRFIGGANGAVLGLIMAGVMNFFSYWFSDKMVLAMYRAKRVGPEDAPMLHRIVARLAERSGLPMPKVYIIPEDSPNAFATGRDPAHASVAATSGILRVLSESELEGVMAHELSHVKNRDILISTIAATLAGAIVFIAHSMQYAAMFGGGRRDDDRGNPFGLAAALLMAVLAPLAAMLVQMAISRSREYAADEGGGRMCGNPRALASALQRIHQASGRVPMASGGPATAHMFIVNPFTGGLAGLFSTHPPMAERVRRLEELSRTM